MVLIYEHCLVEFGCLSTLYHEGSFEESSLKKENLYQGGGKSLDLKIAKLYILSRNHSGLL